MENAKLLNVNFDGEDFLELVDLKEDESFIDKKVDDGFLPDIIIVDGGKGQYSAVAEVLDDLNITIPLFAIAKKEEEIFWKKDGKFFSILLKRNSNALYLVQRIRDESHRFAISYNRKLRNKNIFKSVLDDIKGIGPKTKKKLLAKFFGTRGIKNASDEEILKIVSKNQLKLIRENL